MTIKQVNTNKMLVQCLPHRKDYLRINYFVVVSEHISFQDKEASLSPIYMLLLKENTISFTHLQEDHNASMLWATPPSHWVLSGQAVLLPSTQLYLYPMFSLPDTLHWVDPRPL